MFLNEIQSYIDQLKTTKTVIAMLKILDVHSQPSDIVSVTHPQRFYRYEL